MWSRDHPEKLAFTYSRNSLPFLESKDHHYFPAVYNFESEEVLLVLLQLSYAFIFCNTGPLFSTSIINSRLPSVHLRYILSQLTGSFSCCILKILQVSMTYLQSLCRFHWHATFGTIHSHTQITLNS